MLTYKPSKKAKNFRIKIQQHERKAWMHTEESCTFTVIYSFGFDKL